MSIHITLINVTYSIDGHAGHYDTRKKDVQNALKYKALGIEMQIMCEIEPSEQER
jgi:hypothetical protein